MTKTRIEYSEHPNTGLVWKWNGLKRSGSEMVQILNAIVIRKPGIFFYCPTRSDHFVHKIIFYTSFMYITVWASGPFYLRSSFGMAVPF